VRLHFSHSAKFLTFPFSKRVFILTSPPQEQKNFWVVLDVREFLLAWAILHLLAMSGAITPASPLGKTEPPLGTQTDLPKILWTAGACQLKKAVYSPKPGAENTAGSYIYRIFGRFFQKLRIFLLFVLLFF
jgi:hypothetical protein